MHKFNKANKNQIFTCKSRQPKKKRKEKQSAIKNPHTIREEYYSIETEASWNQRLLNCYETWFDPKFIQKKQQTNSIKTKK